MYDIKTSSVLGLKGIADLVSRAMRLIDTVKEHTQPSALPTPEQLTPDPSTPSTSSAPAPAVAQQFSTALAHTDRLTSTFSNAFGGEWVGREMKPVFQGNELYLGSTAMHLSLRLQSTPKSSPEYYELQSSFRSTLLNLYELTHEDRHLDGAVGAVSLALRGDADGITSTTVVHVRNWAHAQRLVARKEQNFELIQEAVDVAKRTLRHPAPCIPTPWKPWVHLLWRRPNVS